MLQFTESAVAKMREVMQEHNKPYIRFGVKGGGCAGFEYKMDVESVFITEENWPKFPSTLRWRITNKILQTEETKTDF